MLDRKLNILYHHRTQGRGAEGVHIISIVKALESLGHSVTVVSPPGINPIKNAGNAPVDKSIVKTRGIDTLWKFISKNLPGFIFEISEIVYNIPAMSYLEKELSNNKYDLIYERYAFYLVAGAIKAKKYNIPFILEANEVSGIKDRARKQYFKGLCDFFERIIFKRCKSIHTVSSYLKNIIVNKGVDENIIHISPNAIDPDKFTGEKHTGELISKLNLENKIVIGFAGWFDNWDRLDLLVDVFSSLKIKHPSLILLLIGDGAVLKNVRAKVNNCSLSNDVIFTGAVARKEVHNYLSLLDVAVITHSNEFGSPIVLFEFMGLKIPIVAPDLMPITDVLENNKTAMIFKTMDMSDLEFKLDLMIDNKIMRENVSEQAFKKLMDKHTWVENVKEILNKSGVI